MKRVASFVPLVVLLSCVDVALAQQVTGNLIGTVKDESGAILPGVTVTLNSPALLSAGLTTVTNQAGEYRFTGLVPATYSLKASMDGFKTYLEDGLRVLVNTTLERTVVLGVGSSARL